MMNEQKIKQDSVKIGANIRRIRKEENMGQTQLVRELQLCGINMTRECLVKIERGIRHIYASQLKAIKETLDTTYEDLLE